MQGVIGVARNILGLPLSTTVYDIVGFGMGNGAE